MRIGIDARELCGRATGVGRYLAGLLAEWSAGDAARGHDFVLYAPQPIELPLDARRFAMREVAGSGGTLWEQVRLPRVAARDHLDVWFAPGYSAPLTLRIPTVIAIHDLSFVARPEWFTWREGAKRRLIVRRSAYQAAAIVTISQFTRDELIERLAVPAAKIHVIPPGIGHPATTHQASAHPAPQHPTPQHPTPEHPAPEHPTPVTVAPGASYQHPAPSTQHPAPAVLFAGSLFNRRHVPDLIRAFAPIARAHADAVLDIVGDDRSYPREDLQAAIERERMAGRIRWHRYATDSQLQALYARARAFAFLSEYEGLGLTPLEALAAGVPPVVLDTRVAHESCGDAAIYVPLNDIRATTQALERALFSESTRSAILAAAPLALARYRWPVAARETLALLEGQRA